MTDAWKSIAAVGIAIGGVLPYVPQYLYIKRTGDANGFSSFVCLILLVSNTLRIAFYQRQPFEIALLWQSIVMIFAQLIMLELCVRKRRVTMSEAKPIRLASMEYSTFWKWSYMKDYMTAMSFLVAGIYLITCLFPTSELYTNAIGSFALGIEACLGMPQLIQNYRQGTTTGLSVAMVLGWMVGDLFKTTFALTTDAPLQFDICGIIQIAIDLVLLAQLSLDHCRKRRIASTSHGVVVPFHRLEPTTT